MKPRSLADGIVQLSAFGIFGLMLELVIARHWRSPVQLVAWVSLATLMAALWLLWASTREDDHARASRRRRWTARLAFLVALSSAIGVWRHWAGNFDAGPLDRVYGKLWAGMSLLERLWAAAIGKVGPAPTLAPGALALVAGMLWLVALFPPEAPAAPRRLNGDR